MTEADVKKAAVILLAELEAARLVVILVPSRVPECADRGGMIRVAQERNAEWYQNLCAEYPTDRRRRRRKASTKIKRVCVVRALEKIKVGNDPGVYGERLQPFLRDALDRANLYD